VQIVGSIDHRFEACRVTRAGMILADGKIDAQRQPRLDRGVTGAGRPRNDGRRRVRNLKQEQGEETD
jgi:hypothetical protein